MIAAARALESGYLIEGGPADAVVGRVTGEAVKLTRPADSLRRASSEAVSAQIIARTVFAWADRLLSARPLNLYLLLELSRDIGAEIALPEPPESIVALAAEKAATRLAVAARRPASDAVQK